MTINNGTVDLTGGQNAADDATPISGDLVFTNQFNLEIDPPEYQPTFAINFTGPGTFTVDRAGIYNVYADEAGLLLEGLEPITYQELWDVGILQANGLSGVDGADFNTYFTTTGSLGSDNYTLTSKVAGVLPGDYNNNQELDAGDLDLQASDGIANQNLLYDLNGDGVVDYEGDRVMWLHELKKVPVGDADLNGEFTSDDFVTVFTSGLYETGSAATWIQGDWDGDLVFDSNDFVAAFIDGYYEVENPLGGDGVAAVPEPSAVMLSLLGLAGLLGLARRSRR
jgi:hypothetical protein